MRNLLAIALILFATGCGPTISTTSTLSPNESGVPYNLPMGLVPVLVFADEKGVGVTIEPAVTAVDSRVGTLVGRLRPNPFNSEDIKVQVDPETGFLSTVSNDSQAQILAIAEESAKSARRLVFQNSQAQFLSERVVVMQDSFDPLDPADIARINRGIKHAIRHAARAFRAGGGSPTPIEPLVLRVTMPDGSDPFVRPGSASSRSALPTKQCEVGICVRAITSRMIRLEMSGTAFGGKLVNIPKRELLPVGVPSTLFANQTISIKVQDGILQESNLKRDSEALGIVKVPGAVVGGLIAGATQVLEDDAVVSEKEAELVESQQSLIEAEANRDRVALQNATGSNTTKNNAYAREALTIYPYSNALANAVDARIKAAAKAAEREAPPAGGGDLLGGAGGQEDENQTGTTQ